MNDRSLLKEVIEAWSLQNHLNFVARMGSIVRRAKLYINQKEAPRRGDLVIGTDGAGMVVLNHPEMAQDEHGNGYLAFTPEEALNLGQLLINKSLEAQQERP
jgi:hypothetical protein